MNSSHLTSAGIAGMAAATATQGHLCLPTNGPSRPSPQPPPQRSQRCFFHPLTLLLPILKPSSASARSHGIWRIFCRNWLITGRTGSGKTAAGIANIMAQLFRHVPGWGGLAIDQKGLFYRMLLKMASHFGREKDVVLLQVRPDLAPPDWQPPYVFNWLENPFIPGSSYAQLLTDVAQARGAVGTGGSSDHFTQQAKLHIGMAIDALRLLGDIPTCPKSSSF